MADERMDGNTINEVAGLAKVSYDPGFGAGDTTLATPVNARLVLGAGQHVGGKGTTIMNPRPCDPAQEALYGERKYKRTPKENAPNVAKKTIDDLTAKVEMLTRMMAEKIAAPAETAPAETAPVEASPVETAPIKSSYLELLAEAKAIDPTIKGRPATAALESIVFKAGGGK